MSGIKLGYGNFDSMLRGDRALPIPQKGSEPEERGDEANEMPSRYGLRGSDRIFCPNSWDHLTSMKARWSAPLSGADAMDKHVRHVLPTSEGAITH
jgi:hypothetical protein